jgi:hypothetical protein
MLVPDDVVEEIVGAIHDDLIIEKEPEEPKKKSLYSRKLRTKRRINNE